MKSNTIYLELSHPRQLLIALPVGDINYYDPYTFAKVEYSHDILDDITDSKFFTKHSIDELPDGVKDIFEWKHRYAERAKCFYTETLQTKKDGNEIKS